ncbi:uncharacterized protein [Branchiostoma lanceolatum]|uniref:uncharacterized protein n=1 Tax=Branchiostoma lanceolatum TaxID=7740 RepID=UPI003451CEEA
MQVFIFGVVVCLCIISGAQSRSRHRPGSPPLECGLDEYYNSATHHCEGCKDLCQPHRGTLGECKRLCSAYEFPTAVVISLPDGEQNKPSTSPGTTTVSVTEPQDLHRHNPDNDEESIFWRYGTAGFTIAHFCVTLTLVLGCLQQRREIRKLWRLQNPHQHQVQIQPPGMQPPCGLPNNPPPYVPPMTCACASPSANMTAQQQANEAEPLLTWARQDGSNDVPTAPSNRVPIYTTDTKPHTSDQADLLRQDQSATRTPFETEI